MKTRLTSPTSEPYGLRQLPFSSKEPDSTYYQACSIDCTMKKVKSLRHWDRLCLPRIDLSTTLVRDCMPSSNPFVGVHPRMLLIRLQCTQDGPTHSPLVLIRRKTRIRISFDILNLTWKCIAKYIFFYFLHRLPPQKSEAMSIWLHLFLHWLPTGPRIILIAENALLFAKGKIASNGQVEACLVAVTYAAIQVYFVPVRHTC